MKKISIFFLMGSLVFALAACNAPKKAEEQHSNQEIELTQENLLSYPVTEESNFVTETVDGGVSVTICNSEDDVIVIPDTIDGRPVVGISECAFFEMEMKGVVLPDTVTKIEDCAFMMCHNLQYIHLGSGLKSIGELAFTECLLQSVEFPEGMETFESYAFAGCEYLREVIVPDTVVNVPMGVIDEHSCPNAVVVTPAGSVVEADCVEYNVPYRNN